MKFCLEGEIGGKGLSRKFPTRHGRLRAVQVSTGAPRGLLTQRICYVLVIRHGHETIADLWRLFVLLLLGQQIYE